MTIGFWPSTCSVFMKVTISAMASDRGRADPVEAGRVAEHDVVAAHVRVQHQAAHALAELGQQGAVLVGGDRARFGGVVEGVVRGQERGLVESRVRGRLAFLERGVRQVPLALGAGLLRARRQPPAVRGVPAEVGGGVEVDLLARCLDVEDVRADLLELPLGLGAPAGAQLGEDLPLGVRRGAGQAVRPVDVALEVVGGADGLEPPFLVGLGLEDVLQDRLPVHHVPSGGVHGQAGGDVLQLDRAQLVRRAGLGGRGRGADRHQQGGAEGGGQAEGGRPAAVAGGRRGPGAGRWSTKGGEQHQGSSGKWGRAWQGGRPGAARRRKAGATYACGNHITQSLRRAVTA
ncbi:hypothetical protein GCM10010195_54740 [Kitasatospora griseola]|nr:hypothetical protein GCM10010195_54740 [Kitasatospora griseola]